jgi:bacterioferritin-associated ferredoxin
MGPDDQICYCYHVPYRKLWNYACRERLTRASQLSECLGAGTGCGWCIPILKQIFERAQAAAGEPQVDADAGNEDITGMTAEQYAQHRQQYISTKQPRNQF